MKRVFLFLGLAFLLVGCIDEYIPQEIKDVRGILVIEGMIQDGESIFRLSYSVGVSETLDGSEFINDAEVYVESNDGIRLPAVLAGNGTYVVQTPVLDTQKEYRISVTIKGETCESEFLKPTISVEIDSIFTIKNNRGQPIKVYVAAHDAANQSNYYRWQYRETWEVKAELFAHARYLEDENGIIHDWSKLIQHSLFTSENTYYCWGRDSSKTFLIVSTEKLSESRVAQQELISIPCDHEKLSILYRIEVEQIQLREAAYKYFADVKELSERTGDLFSPVLSSGLRGNIYWRNNPNGLIIGYIEVATVTSMYRYIWEREGLYEPPPFNCYPYSSEGIGTIYMWNRQWRYTPAYFNGEAIADKRCVDCRLKEKASKLKPSGWPTDHL